MPKKIRTPHDLVPHSRTFELLDTYRGQWFGIWTDAGRFTPLFETPEEARGWITDSQPDATETQSSLRWS